MATQFKPLSHDRSSAPLERSAADYAKTRPILVTGAPRSGTSWVGRTLAASPPVRYVSEPLLRRNNPCWCGLALDCWYPYVTPSNEPAYVEHLRHSLTRRPLLVRPLLNARSARGVYRAVRGFVDAYSAQRVVVKEPHAIFLADWFARAYDAIVVVVVRHPAGFVSSFKKLGWQHDFSEYLDRPALMDAHLHVFEDEIRQHVDREHDVIDQACLLWKMVHHAAASFRKQHPDWIFVRHEDLARAPVEGFRKLFARTGLAFDDDAALHVAVHSSESNPTEAGDPYSIFRHSRGVADIWRQRLDADEIRRIRRQLEGPASEFFDERDWNVAEKTARRS